MFGAMQKGAIAATVAAVCLSLASALPAASAELVMFVQQGCVWCARWDSEIAPAYPNTDQGRLAPLRRVDIDAPLPPDLEGIAVERFTPTFVLVEDGAEIARMRGYAGDQFFWFLLDEMLAKLEDGVAR